MKILIALVSLSLTSLLTACGTDTGNPGFNPAYGSPISLFMANNVCAKLQQCYPSITSCLSHLESASGFTGAMGLNTTTYPTLADAINGVGSGHLTVNTTRLSQCNASIDALQCSNAAVTSAYSVSAPANLNNAYNMLAVDSACAQTTAP